MLYTEPVLMTEPAKWSAVTATNTDAKVRQDILGVQQRKNANGFGKNRAKHLQQQKRKKFFAQPTNEELTHASRNTLLFARPYKLNVLKHHAIQSKQLSQIHVPHAAIHAYHPTRKENVQSNHFVSSLFSDILVLMIQIILFMAAFGGILVFSHWFVYFSLVKFFLIETTMLKYAIIAILIFLPVSFFLSSYIARVNDIQPTRFLYFISSLWLGVLTALVTFFAIAWILYALNLSISTIALGTAVIILTFVYSAYGVWNSGQTQVTKVTVKIKNLPEEWKGKKVVQISDAHLGLIQSKEFFAKTIKTINKINPAAVFITGDLFDGMGDKFDYLAGQLASLKAPKGTYYITGNHETYFGLDKVYKLLEGSKVHIFHDDMMVVDGLQIIGINYPDNIMKTSVGESLIKFSLAEKIGKIHTYSPDDPSILLYHEPVEIDQAKASGIKLMLSGHTHYGQIFPYQILTFIQYGKYDVGLNTDGDFNIFTSSGLGTWGPYMRVGTKSEIVVITLE